MHTSITLLQSTSAAGFAAFIAADERFARCVIKPANDKYIGCHESVQETDVTSSIRRISVVSKTLHVKVTFVYVALCWTIVCSRSTASF